MKKIEEVEPLERELSAIDEVLHFTAHKMTASEAVKWMNELYGEQCSALQHIAKDFKVGLGGEKLTTAVREGMTAMERENAELRESVQVLVDALKAIRKCNDDGHSLAYAWLRSEAGKALAQITPKS